MVKGGRSSWRLAVSPGVRCDHPIPAAEIGDLFYEIRAVFPVSVQKDKRFAGAFFLII